MAIARKYLRRNEAGFEWRGREVSRLEGLSDAVFGDIVMFTYLAWAIRRVRKLRKRRNALELGLEHAKRGDVGHTLPVAV